MNMNFYSSYERQRRNAFQRFVRSASIFLLVFAVLALTYNLGKNNAEAEFVTEQKEIEALRTQNAKLEKEIVSLRAEAMAAETRLQDAETEYQAFVGNENLRALSRLIKSRLEAGVKPERLQQVITGTSNVRNCSAPESKRFTVATAISKQKKSEVSFGSGLVSISGEGATAINKEGQKEAWYDSEKPVVITIATTGGETIKKEGLLPINYSIVQGDTEYRLTIKPAGKAYAEVVVDQCAYP